MRAGLFMHGESIALKLRQCHRRHLDHQINATRQHFCRAGVGIGDRAEDHRVQLCCAVPVVGVFLDHHGLVRAPLGKFECAGAGGVAAELCAMGLDRLGRYNEARRIGKVRQERRIGRVQLEFYRQVIDRLDALHGGEEEGQRERAGVVEGVVFIEHPLEVEHHRLGIEGAAIVERHTLAQRKCIFGAILGNAPVGGQCGLHLQCAVLVAYQTVIDVHQDTEVIHRRHRRRIKRLGFCDLADDQHARRCLRRRGCHAHRNPGQSRRREHCSQCAAPRHLKKFHVGSSLLRFIFHD